jgi:hypothetical protein
MPKLANPHYAPLGRRISSKASFSSLLLRVDDAVISGELPELNNRNHSREAITMYTAFKRENARIVLGAKRSLLNVGLA